MLARVKAQPLDLRDRTSQRGAHRPRAARTVRDRPPPHRVDGAERDRAQHGEEAHEVRRARLRRHGQHGPPGGRTGRGRRRAAVRGHFQIGSEAACSRHVARDRPSYRSGVHVVGGGGGSGDEPFCRRGFAPPHTKHPCRRRLVRDPNARDASWLPRRRLQRYPALAGCGVGNAPCAPSLPSSSRSRSRRAATLQFLHRPSADLMRP